MQEVATSVSNQLGKALYIRDEAWAYGYLEGFKRMWDHVILNLQKNYGVLEAHLRAVNPKKLDPNPSALNHAGEISRAIISDAFSPADDAPMDPPSKGDGGLTPREMALKVLRSTPPDT